MLRTLLGVFLLLPAAADERFTVSGTVKLKGPVPGVKPNKDILRDPECCKLHDPEKPPPRDTLVVDASGGVKWAFVYVKKGLEGKAFPVPKEPVLIDQVGCTYTPHVFGIMAGQPLDVKNSDPLLHNVHALPFANKEFNKGQPPGAVDRFKLASAEIGVFIKCDIHPWMKTWACVVENPFYAVTDAAGKFEIKNLPAGNYTIGAWHEQFKTEDQQIVVKGAQTVNFTLK